MQALPWLSLGLGVQQTIQGGNLAGQAIAAAKEPRYSPDQLSKFRREGTSNIGANLAERGLLDSSLYTGALRGLEGDVASMASETRGDPSSIMYQRAMGLEQGGGEMVGNLAQLYYMNKLFGGQNPFLPTAATTSPWTTYFPSSLGTPSFLR